MEALALHNLHLSLPDLSIYRVHRFLDHFRLEPPGANGDDDVRVRLAGTKESKVAVHQVLGFNDSKSEDTFRMRGYDLTPYTPLPLVGIPSGSGHLKTFKLLPD